MASLIPVCREQGASTRIMQDLTGQFPCAYSPTFPADWCCPPLTSACVLTFTSGISNSDPVPLKDNTAL